MTFFWGRGVGHGCASFFSLVCQWFSCLFYVHLYSKHDRFVFRIGCHRGTMLQRMFSPPNSVPPKLPFSISMFLVEFVWMFVTILADLYEICIRVGINSVWKLWHFSGNQVTFIIIMRMMTIGDYSCISKECMRQQFWRHWHESWCTRGHLSSLTNSDFVTLVYYD